MSTGGWMRGVIKEVPSADTVIVAAGAGKGGLPGAEKRITLSSVAAPKLVSRGWGLAGGPPFRAACCERHRACACPWWLEPALWRASKGSPPFSATATAAASHRRAACVLRASNARLLLAMRRAAATAPLVTTPLPGRHASSCASSAWARSCTRNLAVGVLRARPPHPRFFCTQAGLSFPPIPAAP